MWKITAINIDNNWITYTAWKITHTKISGKLQVMETERRGRVYNLESFFTVLFFGTECIVVKFLCATFSRNLSCGDECCNSTSIGDDSYASRILILHRPAQIKETFTAAMSGRMILSLHYTPMTRPSQVGYNKTPIYIGANSFELTKLSNIQCHFSLTFLKGNIVPKVFQGWF